MYRHHGCTLNSCQVIFRQPECQLSARRGWGHWAALRQGVCMYVMCFVYILRRFDAKVVPHAIKGCTHAHTQGPYWNSTLHEDLIANDCVYVHTSVLCREMSGNTTQAAISWMREERSGRRRRTYPRLILIFILILALRSPYDKALLSLVSSTSIFATQLE